MNNLEINIELTTRCDADCVFCPRDDYKFEWNTMGFDLFKKVLDDAIQNGAVSLILCGFGDVFMDKGLEEKLVYAKGAYPFLKIFTSSTCNLLVDKKRHLLEHFDTLKISMYGTTQDVYEMIHRGGVKYQRVMDNISYIFNLPNGERPYIAMNFLMLPENEHQVKDWINLWQGKADEIQVWKPHNYGSILDVSFPRHEIQKKSCGRPIHAEPYVHENGDVSVCCFDNERKLVVGNLGHQTLKEVMSGAPLARIVEIHKSGRFDESDLVCKSCDQLTDRTDALIYSSNPKRKVGVLMGHPDLINDLGNKSQK